MDERTYTAEEVAADREAQLYCADCDALAKVDALTHEVYGDRDLIAWAESNTAVYRLRKGHEEQAHPAYSWDLARRVAARREPMVS